jgi:CYTH domain-containing protein
VSLKRPEDEVRQPKYAQYERERRWLVDPAARVPLEGAPVVGIEDRYISGTRIRLRRMTDGAGKTSYKLTRKYEATDPAARMIVTAYLTAEEHAVFAALPAARLVKKRHKLAHNGLSFSLDLFEGAHTGLALTEIEMPDHPSLCAVEPPHWAGPEVTHIEAFEGGNLAASGLVPSL